MDFLKRAECTIILLIVSQLLIGCQASIVNIKKLPQNEQAAIAQLPIFNSQQLSNREFVVLGLVEGLSCQDTFFGAVATRTLAVEQAKYSAVKLKADGITNLQFSEGAAPHCYKTIMVSAEAIAFVPRQSSNQ
jgi:hypothetical protein